MADFDPDKYLERKKKSEPFDPDKYLAKTRPETALQTLGRSTASLADTALNAITGTLDYAAYPLARAFGRSPEQAQQETTSPKDVVGRAFGVTGTPGYEQAIPRRVGRAIGETLGENVIKPIARTTGIPEQDVGSMLGTATLAAGPAVPKVASASVSGAQKVAPLVKAPIDVGRGFYQGARGVEPGSAKSAVVPLRDTYYPTPEVQQFMRGEIDLPTLQASQKPSSSLFATPEQQSALRMAERMPGEPNVPLIPVQGKGYQAFGERIGREYVTDPYRAAADVGLSVVAGIPLPLSAAQRALQARQSRTLSQAANFDPMFRQRLAQAEATPTTPPVSGPIAPQQTTPTVNLAQLAAQRSAQEAAKSTQPAQQMAAQQVAGPVIPEQLPASRWSPTEIQQVQQAQKALPETTAPATSQSLFAGQPSPVPARKQQMLQQNPELARYGENYVIPEALAPIMDDFVSGNSKNLVVYGPPGTGKTSLSGEWMNKNPGGKFEVVHAESTLKDVKNIAERLKFGDKTLVLIDEIDKVNPKVSKYVTDVLNKNNNTQLLYTTNNVKGVPESVKNTSTMLDVNPMLSPDQKLMYAISTAERYGTLKTLPELESIANASNNFRDIKRQVTNGVQLKQEPLFTNEIPKLNYVSDSAQTLLENFNNNKTSKNVLIFDSTALSKNPKLSSELDKITTVTSMENINNVVPNLVSGSTMSPTFRLVINDATDAKTLSGLKGLIERSNETQYPTKLIIEDRFGKLDPAILSRGEVVTGKDIIGTTPKKKAPSNVSQMLTPEDTFKALKQDVPRSEMSITEGKIFDMTQAERNAYEQTLKTELSKAKYDMDKKLIQNALNLIEKYRYK